MIIYIKIISKVAIGIYVDLIAFFDHLIKYGLYSSCYKFNMFIHKIKINQFAKNSKIVKK